MIIFNDHVTQVHKPTIHSKYMPSLLHNNNNETITLQEFSQSVTVPGTDLWESNATTNYRFLLFFIWTVFLCIIVQLIQLLYTHCFKFEYQLSTYSYTRNNAVSHTVILIKYKWPNFLGCFTNNSSNPKMYL